MGRVRPSGARSKHRTRVGGEHWSRQLASGHARVARRAPLRVGCSCGCGGCCCCCGGDRAAAAAAAAAAVCWSASGTAGTGGAGYRQGWQGRWGALTSALRPAPPSAPGLARAKVPPDQILPFPDPRTGLECLRIAFRRRATESDEACNDMLRANE